MQANQESIDKWFSVIESGSENDAYAAADKLALVENEEVLNRLTSLLSSASYDTVYLAARAISKRKDNNQVIETFFELIKKNEQPFISSVLTEALSGFDCSEHFVEVLKLYLFGNMKTSAMAKEILEDQEFAITPRVIRKAEKHWNHFVHNSRHDEAFNIKKREYEEMMEVMKELFDEEDKQAEEEDQN